MRRIVIALLVGLVGLVGCSDSSDGTGSGGTGGSGDGSGGTGGSGGSGGSGGPASGDAGIPTGTCTEPGSVCATFKFPAASEMPTRLIVGFYKGDLPPLGPPDALGMQVDMPAITPSAEVTMKMLDIAQDGDFHMYSALYMPGGGQYVTKKGVDYDAFTTQKVTLSKTAAINLPGKFEYALVK
jgi:hypothetical protein